MKKQKGATFVELLIYIALVSIFVTGAIFFAWDVVYGREKAYQQQIVEQNARIALARIAYEIRRAADINSVSASSIELENGANDTTISFSSETIQITTEGAGPYDLTSNQIAVTDLSFTDLSTDDEMTKDIGVSLSVRQAQTAVSGQFEAETTMSESVELNSQFNQARRLLVDASGAILSANTKDIEGITIQNTGSDDVIIEQMAVSWTETDADESLTEIQIDAGTIEWSGSRSSNTDLFSLDNSYTLTAAAGVIDIDYFEFDKSMEDAIVTFVFGLSDGSTVEVEAFLIIEEVPTATPTPTPTSAP